MFNHKNCLHPRIKNLPACSYHLLQLESSVHFWMKNMAGNLQSWKICVNFFFFFLNFQSCLCCCCSQSKSLVTSVPMNGTSIQWKNQELNNHNTDRSSHKDSINWKLRTLIPLQNQTGKKKSQQSYFSRKPSDCSIINSDMYTLVPNSRGDWVDWLAVTVMFYGLRSTGW